MSTKPLTEHLVQFTRFGFVNAYLARTLRALEPPLLAVGHGPAVHAPAAATDRAIARGASSTK